MTCRCVARVTPTLEQNLALLRLQRQGDDLPVIPCQCGRESHTYQCVKDRVAIRKNLRSMREFTLLDSDDGFGCSTASWHALNAACPLSENNHIVRAPAHAVRIGGLTDCLRRPAVDSDTLQCLIGRPVSNGFPVRRKQRVRNTRT